MAAVASKNTLSPYPTPPPSPFDGSVSLPDVDAHWPDSLGDSCIAPARFVPLSLSLSPNLLALLAGARVLRVGMSSSLGLGLTAAAATDRLIQAESKLIESGSLSLRRASSETSVPRKQTPSVSFQPPTPTAADSPATAPPTLPRRAAPRFSSPSPSPLGSPMSSPRAGQSSLGITIHGNVLPAVRSPRKNATEPLVPSSRRARRPRLFGFTGIESPLSSATSSLANSPENPGSPVDQRANPMTLPRRNPVRVKSETSLETLGAVEQQPKVPHRPRRDTGLKLDLKDIVPQPGPHSAGWGSFNGVVKKKSGEVVRPALKNAGPLLPNGTPVDKTGPIFGSKSCPTTPSCPKYVHFDAQLERVKLFLHDQRPEVVSRQGSPTEHLSDDEHDTEDEGEAEKILQVKLPNFPTYNSPDVDIYMESLGLNDARDAVRGIVAVRNLGFQKHVTVRFTFDWWQTTSEVSATHKDSIRGGSFDRFQFSIQLCHMLERIEEKTLFMCTRYNVNGGEIWDSNHGQNYQVLFERKAKDKKKRYMPKRTKVVLPGMGRSVGGGAWSVSGSSTADHLADLRAKLNRLNAEDRELNAPISPRTGRGGSIASPRSVSPRKSASPLPSGRRAVSQEGALNAALAGRYDFTSALKTSRLSPTLRGGDLPSPRSPGGSTEFYSPRPAFLQLHGMGPSSPLAGPASPNPLADSPSSPLSPVPHSGVAEPLTGPGSLPALASANSSSTSSLSSVSSMTVTPLDTHTLSLPRVDVSFSDTSDTQSETPSPLSPPSDSPFSPADMLPFVNKDTSDDMSQASYSTFIEQFCWGGAMGDGGAGLAPSSSADSAVRRVHSTSSLDHYFSSPPDLTPRAFTPTQGLSRTTSANGGTSTPPSLRARGTPPSLEDLAHVDSAIRSLTSSRSNTPETSPIITAAPAMTRIPSNSAILTA